MPYRKATSLDVDCNYHMFTECVLFMELDYALIFLFLQIAKLLLCLCAASSLRRVGGRWCNGAVTSSCRDQWRSLMQEQWHKSQVAG